LKPALRKGFGVDPTHQAEWVAVVDGDTTQIDYIQQAATKYGATAVVILDIIHVLEYLWKAANACVRRRGRQRRPVGSGPDRATAARAEAVAGPLLTARRHRQGVEPETTGTDRAMHHLSDQSRSLSELSSLPGQGVSIATGVIEGACRYVVKDRMEITGARWGLEGGEAVLKLRALYLNGRFRGVLEIHEQQEYQRNHQAKFAEMPKARSHLRLIPTGKG